jgi:predicted GH43/DUF377 family glycosyl hydrolase
MYTNCKVRLLVLLGCFVLGLCTKLPYLIARSTNSTVYLINRRMARRILDDATVVTLGYSPDSLETISQEELDNLTIGPDVPTIMRNNQTPDEITRVEILIYQVIQGEIVRQITRIGDYINPSIVLFKGRLLLATGLAWGFAGTKQKPATNTLEYRWLNHSDYPFYTEGTHLGVANEVEPIGSPSLGQDPRIAVTSDPDRFHVYFTNPMSVCMGKLEFAVNNVTNEIERVSYFHTIYYAEGGKSVQKNWSPFLYRNNVLLIQSINPLVVVKTSPHSEERLMAYDESRSPPVGIYWPYGHLRGGTNAVFVREKGVYLAFFHSAGNIPGNSMKTYAMGAYTFTAEAPFRLVSTSPGPIMPEAFYTGPWDPLRNRGIDYCVFPMSIYLEERASETTGTEVVMGLGFQDGGGYMVRFDLEQLWRTLVPVQPLR